MRCVACACLGVFLLAACGGDAEEGASPVWHHATLTGFGSSASPGQASGLTLVGGDLLLVCGDDDRDIYTIERDRLRPGGALGVRTLSVEYKPDAPLMGSEPFALQEYTLDHLWKVPVDFQAIAAQAPDYLYVGERQRRLILWGRLTRDAAGRLAHIKFDHVTVAPGADRSAADAADWRDKGPGLRGLVAVERSARMEDLWLVDAGAPDQPIMVRRLDRYGSNLRGLRARHGFEGSPDVRAISWDKNRLVMLLGRGRGRFSTLKPPAPGKLVSVPKLTGVPGPEIEGVEGWTGMAHAKDGTIFLVSGGSPTIVAWRKP